jgi:hypothetical protein
MGAGAPEEFTNGRTWMQSRTSILAGAAVLALTATPTLAMTHHHHRMHHSQLHESTPAERQQTADLNRQQLAKAENAGSTVSTATATSGTTEQSADAADQLSARYGLERVDVQQLGRRCH